MTRFIVALALFLSSGAYAQQGQVAGPNSPCTAFGTTSGTCLQGNGNAATATTTNQINGVDLTAAWATYTPTITCTAGSITTDTVAGRYKAIGKTVAVQIILSVSTLGTCTGNVTFTTPPALGVNTTGATYPLSAYNASTNGAVVVIASQPSSIIMIFAVAPAAQTYVINGTYEAS